MKIKYYILLICFFMTMITSLWDNNVYILFLFCTASWLILPYKKWWDNITILLLLFSIFYSLIQYWTIGIFSGFTFLCILFGPVAFYRFGRWMMATFKDENSRLLLLFFTILLYLLPLIQLTISDIILVGLVNDSRVMTITEGNGNALNATLYGLAASVGIGSISLLFANGIRLSIKCGFTIISLLSMMTVIHLLNRSGLVIFFACIVFAFLYSTKLKINKLIPTLFLIFLVLLIITQTEIIGSDIIDGYAKREDNVNYSAAELGGRSELWLDAAFNIFTNPFGWERKLGYAHNLWLDLAAIGGLLAFIPFTMATLITLKNCIKQVLKPASAFNLLVLGSLCSMFLNSMVEPVIEGSTLFFLTFIMMWGVVKTISIEKI